MNYQWCLWIAKLDLGLLAIIEDGDPVGIMTGGNGP
jgi:hypothetical protein